MAGIHEHSGRNEEVGDVFHPDSFAALLGYDDDFNDDASWSGSPLPITSPSFGPSVFAAWSGPPPAGTGFSAEHNEDKGNAVDAIKGAQASDNDDSEYQDSFESGDESDAGSPLRPRTRAKRVGTSGKSPWTSVTPDPGTPSSLRPAVGTKSVHHVQAMHQERATELELAGEGWLEDDEDITAGSSDEENGINDLGAGRSTGGKSASYTSHLLGGRPNTARKTGAKRPEAILKLRIRNILMSDAGDRVKLVEIAGLVGCDMQRSDGLADDNATELGDDTAASDIVTPMAIPPPPTARKAPRKSTLLVAPAPAPDSPSVLSTKPVTPPRACRRHRTASSSAVTTSGSSHPPLSSSPVATPRVAAGLLTPESTPNACRHYASRSTAVDSASGSPILSPDTATTNRRAKQMNWTPAEIDFARDSLRIIVADGDNTEARFDKVAKALNEKFGEHYRETFGPGALRTKHAVKNQCTRIFRLMNAQEGLDFDDRRARKDGKKRALVTSARENKKRKLEAPPAQNEHDSVERWTPATTISTHRSSVVPVSAISTAPYHGKNAGKSTVTSEATASAPAPAPLAGSARANKPANAPRVRSARYDERSRLARMLHDGDLFPHGPPKGAWTI